MYTYKDFGWHEGSGMAAWERRGFVSHHAAGHSPQWVSHLRWKALLSYHLILYFLPGHPGQTETGQETLDSFPRAEQSINPLQGVS